MSGGQLELVEDLDVVDGMIVVGEGTEELAPATAMAGAAGALARNLFVEADRLAARASTAGTRRKYAAIYRAFARWLRDQLDRLPVVGDLDADVIAAYGRYLATSGGRGGRPASPATARVYLSMVRALARQLGRETRSRMSVRRAMSRGRPRR